MWNLNTHTYKHTNLLNTFNIKIQIKSTGCDEKVSGEGRHELVRVCTSKQDAQPGPENRVLALSRGEQKAEKICVEQIMVTCSQDLFPLSLEKKKP